MKSRPVRLSALGALLATVIATDVLAQSIATAESDRAVTIHQMVERALASHPRVGAARAGGDRASALVREARAARFPALSTEWSATRFQEPMIVAPLHGFDPTTPPGFNQTLIQSRWRVSYTLFDGGARGATVRGSVAGLEGASAAFESARAAVIDQVATAYLAVLTARGVHEAETRRVQSLEAERARVQQLLDVGRAASVERLRVDATVASARAAQITAAQGLFTALRELARLTGLDTAALDPAAFQEVTVLTPADPEPIESLERARTANPLLAAARHRVTAAGQHERSARATRFPSLQLVGGLNTFGDASGEFIAEWQTGIALTYPLWTGGARSGRIAVAAADARAAHEELRQIELDVATTIDRASAAVWADQARAAALALAVTHLTEVARIEQLSLSAGAGVQTDYLRAEADLASARAEEVRARHAEILARLQLAKATGDLSMEWLNQYLEVRQ